MHWSTSADILGQQPGRGLACLQDLQGLHAHGQTRVHTHRSGAPCSSAACTCHPNQASVGVALIQWCSPPCLPALPADLDCRLLLSIDREKGVEDAMATVELAAQLQDKGVVGVALTGAQLCFALAWVECMRGRKELWAWPSQVR